MKRTVNAVGMLLAAVGLFCSAGCDTIRDYSISSYQGPMPTTDARSSSGSAAPKADPEAIVAAQPAPTPASPAPSPNPVPAGTAPVLQPDAPATNPQ